jgi:F-type H+-transporting ATPase subunit b
MSFSSKMIGLILAIALVYAQPLWAAKAAPADKHGDNDHAKDGHGDAHKGAVAAPDPLKLAGLHLDLGLWSAVVFVLLLLILASGPWRWMLDGLKKREETIVQSMENARKLNEETAKLQSKTKEMMDQASAQAREIVDEARRDAQRLKDEIVAQGKAEVQSDRDRLRRELDLARDQALHELWTKAAELASLVSTKAIKRNINEDDHRRLVQDALDELQRAGTERQREIASVRA